MTRTFLLSRSFLVAAIGVAVGAGFVLSFARPPVANLAPVGAVRAIEPVAVSAVAATRGDVQQTLSYNGDIRAREQITVLPKTAGRVERVLVDVGSRLSAGDAIALLEQDSAQFAVLQARAAVAGAEARLATLQAGARTEDVAAAQAALSLQLVRLQNIRSGGRAEDIRSAQDAVAAAQARLTALQNGADDSVRQAAQSAVDSDRAALASAEAAFAALGGQNATALQTAESQVIALQAQVASAEAVIRSADAALNSLTGSSAGEQVSVS